MPSEADLKSLLSSHVATSVAELCKDNRDAAETLLLAVKRDLEVFGARFKLEPADLDDLVSDSVLTLLSKDGDFEGGVPGVKAWMHTTLSVKALALWRKRARAKLREAGEEAFEELGVCNDPLAGLESEAQRAFLAARVPTLSSGQELVVLLRLTNHDWNSVAWICSFVEGHELTVNAVRCRCGDAVEKLREEYERLG